MGNKVEEVLGWIYTLIGRMQHSIGTLDNWQVILAFIGIAGTGKSTMIDVINDFYEEEDIGSLSGVGDKFAVASIAGCTIWSCAEMSKDMRISQEQLQQMISGERIAVRGFHQDWARVHWKSPGILGGNFLPKWTNNHGSLTRRIIMIGFFRAVTKAMKDPHLKKKIDREMPLFLYKTARMYMLNVRVHGSNDLWGKSKQFDLDIRSMPRRDANGNFVTKVFDRVLPEYFHCMRAIVGSQTDPLRKFLMGAASITVIREARTVVNRVNQRCRIATREVIQNARLDNSMLPDGVQVAIGKITEGDSNKSNTIHVPCGIPIKQFLDEWKQWTQENMSAEDLKHVRVSLQSFEKLYAQTAMESGVFLFEPSKQHPDRYGTMRRGLWVANVKFVDDEEMAEDVEAAEAATESGRTRASAELEFELESELTHEE